MRRLMLYFALLVALLLGSFSAALAYDGQVMLNNDQTRMGWSGGESGGEFQMTTRNWTGPALVRGVATKTGNWSTFCAQFSELVGFGTYYNGTLAMVTDHSPPYLPLDARAAWLYHEWNHKALVGYVYDESDGGVARRASARDLMELLWKVGGEVAPYQNNARQQQWLALAEAGKTDLNKTRGVRILQLYDTVDRQDLYAEVVPEPTSLALLALGSLPVLPMLRRRRSA